MTTIGIITDINIDGFIPLIESIEITIYDSEKEEVVTIYPTEYKRDYPYRLFESIEYNKINDSIRPVDLSNENTRLTRTDRIAHAKCLAVVADRFKNVFEKSLYKPLSK